MNDEYRLRMEAQDLTKQPPTEEPERQYYFMKKCREIVKKKSEELGRPLTCYLKSFGCQMYASHPPDSLLMCAALAAYFLCTVCAQKKHPAIVLPMLLLNIIFSISFQTFVSPALSNIYQGNGI